MKITVSLLFLWGFLLSSAISVITSIHNDGFPSFSYDEIPRLVILIVIGLIWGILNKKIDQRYVITKVNLEKS